MPTLAEALAGHAVFQIGASVTELVELYRDNPEAQRLLRDDADLIEDAYRRLGDFVHLIRPKMEAA